MDRTVTRMISITPFLFVVLMAAVENAVIPTGDTNNRILGGENASIEEFPSMVHLDLRAAERFHYCGGTIISNRWVLTAAHCVHRRPTSDVRMKVGSENVESGGSSHRTARIIVHEGYRVKKDEEGHVKEIQNDIALVEAKEPFPLNDLTIKAARLPLQDEDTTEGTVVMIVGWGRMEGNKRTDYLKKANTEIISREQCQESIPVLIDRRNLCARNSEEQKQTCKGDSGGPLYNNDMLVGITSFGAVNCTWDSSPDVFTSVAYFRQWIKQNSGI